MMRQGTFTRVVTPQPPPFLTGPAALLLTNSPGFSARIEVQGESSTGSEKSLSGALLCNGGKVVFAPDSDASIDMRYQPGGYSFIWDVSQSRGYVLSDALQAYAPVVADLHVTNIQSSIGKSDAQRISGHPCELATVTAQMADGASTQFTVFEALDLRHLPLRIQTQTPPVPFTLNLSKVRIETVPASVFAPPEGFTQYPNPQAMADELAARQHNLRRKTDMPLEPLPGMDTRRY